MRSVSQTAMPVKITDSGTQAAFSHTDLKMILLHGLFDLRPGASEEEFRAAFQAFHDHLKSKRLAISARFMRHEPRFGYDARPPETEFYIAIEFVDREQAERCWSCVEAADEPLHTLHSCVNRLIQKASFFLYSDVDGR